MEKARLKQLKILLDVILMDHSSSNKTDADDRANDVVAEMRKLQKEMEAYGIS